MDPQSVLDKGWWEGDKIYFRGQNVTLSPKKVRIVLRQAMDTWLEARDGLERNERTRACEMYGKNEVL